MMESRGAATAVFQSLYSDPDLLGLKIALLYFDRITLLDEGTAWARTDRINEDGTRTGTISGVLRTAPDEVVEMLKTSGAIEHVSVLHLGVDEEGSREFRYEDSLDRLTTEFVAMYGTGLPLQDPEIGSVSHGSSPVLDCRDPSFDDYMILYCFLAAAGIFAMHELEQPFCTDSSWLNQTLARTLAEVLPRLAANSRLEVLRALKESWLAREVLKIEVPNLTLRSLEDVLEARRRFRPELERFRVEIGALSTLINSESVDESLIQEIDRIVRGRVRPAVSELERRLESAGDRFVLRLAHGLRSPGAYVPLLGTLLGNIPLAACVAGSVGSLTLEAAVETYFDRRQVMDSSGLGYLLKIR